MCLLFLLLFRADLSSSKIHQYCTFVFSRSPMTLLQMPLVCLAEMQAKLSMLGSYSSLQLSPCLILPLTRALPPDPFLLPVQLLDVLQEVLKDLQDKKLLRWPKIYLHPSCESEAADLKAKIIRLRGEVAASAGKLFGILSQAPHISMYTPFC